MKLIESSVDRIQERNPFKLIEKVGRTCYKSTSDMTEETARAFYSRMAKSHHYAMLEHATFCFMLNEVIYHVFKENYGKYLNFTNDNGRYLMSGNLRALNETDDQVILKALYDIDPLLAYNELYSGDSFSDFLVSPYIRPVDAGKLDELTENEFLHHVYFTYHFITDRGVTHEIVRHRPASYAQESTRYCNYSKDKFNRELTCVKPFGYEDWTDRAKVLYEQVILTCEKCYNEMVECGLTAQQVRAVLPHAVKAELILTANGKEWEHILDLRYRGTTGAPHPDMRAVMEFVYQDYIKEKDYYMTPEIPLF